MRRLEEVQKEKRELGEKLIAENAEIQIVLDVMKQAVIAQQKEPPIFIQPSSYNQAI